MTIPSYVCPECGTPASFDVRGKANERIRELEARVKELEALVERARDLLPNWPEKDCGD